MLGKGTKKGVREIAVNFPSHTVCLQPLCIPDWLSAVDQRWFLCCLTLRCLLLSIVAGLYAPGPSLVTPQGDGRIPGSVLHGFIL